MGWRYIVALGSNVCDARHGRPSAVLRAAIMALDGSGLGLGIAARQIQSVPLGPSSRRYANTVALVVSDLDPPAVLARLKAIERAFGRRPGRRWGARVLDLDIVLWSGGRWRSEDLSVPHPHYRERAFVLGPLCAVAPRWRDPHSGLTPRHLHARLTRPRPLPKRGLTHPPGRRGP